MSWEEASPPSPLKSTNKVGSEISTKGKEERPQWGNQIQFIFSAVGLAVGLGNIWRFPSVAYENGGAAFLIPYLCCGILFGLPMVYAEFMMGQYSRSGPGLVTGRYAAGLRGVGWSMTVNAISVAIFYCVLIAWAVVYLSWIFSGQSHLWTECGNKWNTPNCVSQSKVAHCKSLGFSYYSNGICSETQPAHPVSPSEEFFINYMTTRSAGIGDFQGFNWPVLGALLGVWILTCTIMIKGIEYMGYVSYVIVPFPYIIVCILFFRGITLEGAFEGIKYYLLEPDFSKLRNPNTWAAALKQLMFSMSIGYGGLISLSSYSKPENNFFRDSLIVIFGDTLMSLIGGVAVFSVLGYLSKMTGKKVQEIVQSGSTLAFIVYPEAISTMSWPWLWNALFFLMLFFLGITSEIAFVETFTGLIFDCFPATKKRKWIITLATCASCQLVALLMVTHAGWYWFNLFDEFIGSTCACVVAAVEVLILSYYGWGQVEQDWNAMRGETNLSGWKRWISPRSPLFGIFWATLCPLLALIIAGIQLNREIPFKIPMGSITPEYIYPVWAEVIGWTMNLGSLLPIPLFFIYKFIQYEKMQINWKYLFRPSKGLPSFHRYYEQKGIREPKAAGERERVVINQIPASPHPCRRF